MRKTIGRVLPYLAPHRRRFAIAQVAMLVGTAAGLAFPWAIRDVFDHLLAGAELRYLLLAVGLLSLVALLREVGNYIKNNALGYIGQRIVSDLRGAMYEKLLRFSLGYYSRQSTGDITSRLTNDIYLFQEGLSAGLTYVVQQVLTLVAVVVLLVAIDPLLAGALLVIMPLVILVSRRAGQRVKSISRVTQETLAQLMGTVSESVSGIDIIKAFVLERRALRIFGGQNDQVLDRSVEAILLTNRARLGIGLLNACVLLLTIGLGGYRVHIGRLTMPDLIAFILYSEMVAGPLGLLAGLYVEVNKAVAAFQRVLEVLDGPEEVREVAQPVCPQRLQGRIRFDDVSFAYDGEHPVLHRVSLDVAPGETIALVGPSGAGKSTLAKLIPRFYDPGRGQISVDGTDLRRMDLATLRANVGIVPQDTYLFGFSIEENIACGRPEATHEEIVRAAQLANADDFVQALEEGYRTRAGERGVRLSGGQKQRIAIARAFLKDPPILILDEATSALDSRSEARVQDALQALMAGRTTLTIAHRLSTVLSADRIVVLDAGHIVDVGSHQELLSRCALYRTLYERQFGATPPAPGPLPLTAGEAAGRPSPAGQSQRAI